MQKEKAIMQDAALQLTFDYGSLDLPAEQTELIKSHAESIRLGMRRTIHEVFEVGRRLSECRDLIPHGSWEEWLQAEFNMRIRSAQRFMGVWERIGSQVSQEALPSSVGVLYELSAPSFPEELRSALLSGEAVELDGQDLELAVLTKEQIKELKIRTEEAEEKAQARNEKIEAIQKEHDEELQERAGRIRELEGQIEEAEAFLDMEVSTRAEKQAQEMVKNQTAELRDELRIVREASDSWKHQYQESEKARKEEVPLPRDKYGVIIADPPWDYRNSGVKGAAENQYRTMSLRELIAYPVDTLGAEDSVMFLWCTWPQAEVGIKLLRAWGYEYVTGFPWVKLSDEPDIDNQGRLSGKISYGTGYWVRGVTEMVLIGKKGRPSRPDGSWAGLLLMSKRFEHSRKPDNLHQVAEQMPGPYLELFGRRPKEGWDVWGNEVTEDRLELEGTDGESQES